MERVVLRHLSGSKSNQVEEFPTLHFPEIIVGRDPGSTVKFDPDRDDLVGRQHAKILTDPQKPGTFRIVDLNSRNGTYVNHQRIFGEARIAPGDIIQFGPGGPQLQFDIEPKTTTVGTPTRLAVEPTASGSAPAAIPPTREKYSDSGPAWPELQGTRKAGVGRATVERMIDETTARTRRNVIIGASTLGALGLIGGGWMYRRRPAAPAAAVARDEMTPTEVFNKHSKSVVFIEAAWQLTDIETGRQVYHLHLENPGGNPLFLPVFTDLHGRREPLLIDNDQDGTNPPIGRALAASGFVVTQDGFILTNQHVAASWEKNYYWAPDQRGWVFPGGRIVEGSELPRDWVPTKTKSIVMRGRVNRAQVLRLNTQQNPPRALQGKHHFLEVVFPDTSIRIPARLTKNSPTHDVSLIKVDVAEHVQPLEMDDQREIKAGEPVIVLGYPEISLSRYASFRPRDGFRAESERTKIPDVTVSTGNIGKVSIDKANRTVPQDFVVNTMGDFYQLTVNSTGRGNSGGPVFDTRGKVIGIFYAFSSIQGDASVSYALPIKYGTELTKGSKTVA